jgi:hypothetical protein
LHPASEKAQSDTRNTQCQRRATSSNPLAPTSSVSLTVVPNPAKAAQAPRVGRLARAQSRGRLARHGQSRQQREHDLRPHLALFCTRVHDLDGSHGSAQDTSPWPLLTSAGGTRHQIVCAPSCRMYALTAYLTSRSMLARGRQPAEAARRPYIRAGGYAPRAGPVHPVRNHWRREQPVGLGQSSDWIWGGTSGHGQALK